MLPILKTRNMPNIFDDIFGRNLMNEFLDNTPGFSVPAVNIAENNDSFRIEVAAPGLSKDDFKVDIQNNVLTISSEKENSKEEKDDKYMRREFNYSSFKRSFVLPNSADLDKVNASHKDGILAIEVMKKEEAKLRARREIAIN